MIGLGRVQGERPEETTYPLLLAISVCSGPPSAAVSAKNICNNGTRRHSYDPDNCKRAPMHIATSIMARRRDHVLTESNPRTYPSPLHCDADTSNSLLQLPDKDRNTLQEVCYRFQYQLRLICHLSACDEAWGSFLPFKLLAGLRVPRSLFRCVF